MFATKKLEGHCRGGCYVAVRPPLWNRPHRRPALAKEWFAGTLLACYGA
jgi:hypothetical protein